MLMKVFCFSHFPMHRVEMTLFTLMFIPFLCTVVYFFRVLFFNVSRSLYFSEIKYLWMFLLKKIVENNSKSMYFMIIWMHCMYVHAGWNECSYNASLFTEQSIILPRYFHFVINIIFQLKFFRMCLCMSNNQQQHRQRPQQQQPAIF